MRRYIARTIILIVAFVVSDTVGGQTTWSGEMSGDHTESGTINVAETITVKNGKTLRIKNKNGSLKLKATNDMDQMFKVEDGGTLIIEGTTDRNSIVIDGGAIFNGGKPFNETNYNQVKNTGKKTRAIYNNNGTLTLKNLTIQNADILSQKADGSPTGAGGAILIKGTNYGEERKTTIDNCLIQYCVSEQGSALQVTNSNGDQKGNAENCSVTVSNTTIQYCYANGIVGFGDSSGGTIRTNGNCVSNLYLKKVDVKNNYSGGCGGGVYWNGAGTTETCCYFDGCNFLDNVAKVQGGAMMLETTFDFKSDGDLTTIKGNKVLNEGGTGGGVVVTSYGGQGLNVVEGGQYTFNFNLTDKLRIEDNIAGNGAGISFNFQKYQLNEDWNNNDTESYQVTTNIHFNGTIIKGNEAKQKSGGGIMLWNNTDGNNGNRKVLINVYLNKGEISGNKAVESGGGFYSYKADISHESDKTGLLTISNNELTGDNSEGGGIYVDGGTSINLATTSIKENLATSGGALAISDNSADLKISLGKSTISNNKVLNKGGAIYLPQGNLTLVSPTIEGNLANNGGAIYVEGNVTIKEKLEIKGNIASNDGGAIYVEEGILDIEEANSTISENTAKNGGVFCVNDGAVKLGTADITNNSASENGGAIALYNGTFTMGANSIIKNNMAKNFGGGLYVNNSNETQVEIECTGGTFTDNAAKAGGAVCANGNINLTLAASMENNTAQIGGGIYMANGVNMTFGDGLIRSNSASDKDNESDCNTASGKDVESVAGVGGGIFMANNTTLTFNSKEMGIYNNYATNAGADICANGTDTSITLPAIQSMSLKGFEVPGNDLYWVYDYFNEDTDSENGIGDANTPAIRYEELLKRPDVEILNYIVQDNKDKEKTFNNYVCLDLGYDLVFVEFTTSGLEHTENYRDNVAILMNYPKKDDGGTTEFIQYRKVLFNGNQTKTVGLPSGEWQLLASEWGVHYNKPTFNPNVGTNSVIEIKRNINDKINILFTEKGNAYKEINSKVYEHYKVNRMVVPQ